MPSNYTPNYQLNQWEKSDKVLMDDFNADNAKIDAAIKAEVDARAALAAQVALRGNCRIWTTSYTGNDKAGSANPTRVTFPEVPLLALITDIVGNLVVLTPGAVEALFNTAGEGSAWLKVSWKGSTVSYYHNGIPMYQMNYGGRKYSVFAFFAADAE